MSTLATPFTEFLALYTIFAIVLVVASAGLLVLFTRARKSRPLTIATALLALWSLALAGYFLFYRQNLDAGTPTDARCYGLAHPCGAVYVTNPLFLTQMTVFMVTMLILAFTGGKLSARRRSPRLVDAR